MGADATNDEAAAKALTAWQASHAERLHRAESALREWTELENILDGRSLADFESLVKPARAARNATEGLDPADIAAQIIDGDIASNSRPLEGERPTTEQKPTS